MNIHCQRKGDKAVTSPRQEQHNAKKDGMDGEML